MPTYTDKQIIDALEKSRGMVYVAAKALGCAPDTIKKRIAEVKAVKDHVAAQREMTTDVAELKLFQAIQAGDPWAIQFYLKMQARMRGYAEKQDVNLTGEVDLKIPFLTRRGDLAPPKE